MCAFRSEKLPTRQEIKSRKRKHEEDILDIPDGAAENDEIAWSVQQDEEKSKLARNERKRQKKEKRDKLDSSVAENRKNEKISSTVKTTNEDDPAPKKKSKKSKRKDEQLESIKATEGIVRKEPQEIEETGTATGSTAESMKVTDSSKAKDKRRERKRKDKKACTTNTEDLIEDDVAQLKKGAQSQPEKATKPLKPAHRYIVFIGNLPFTTTTEALTNHFSSILPDSIRHLTHKGTPKSKGYAFLEFEGYDRMKTCLKLFHHTMFDDGVSPARKINVELTAGGGGNTKDRKMKLQAKNSKLGEERKRRAEAEAVAKAEQAVEKAKKSEVKDKEGANTEGHIHPSRRGQVVQRKGKRQE